MTDTRIKISSIVENQLPEFVREEYPLVTEFLSQYYISLESQGGVTDLLQNLASYIKLEELTNLIEFTTLTQDVLFGDDVVNVVSTEGFPDSYGLLLIDDEIITYTSKTPTTFEGCVRGFSGVTSYNSEFIFSQSEQDEHITGVEVQNLSILFLKEFFTRFKAQFAPGFESREFDSRIDERLFISRIKDFYASKGTDNSFKILFGALYGEKVDVIKPRDYLIEPSNAQYRITADIVAEQIEGNPEDLINSTLFQDKTSFLNDAQGTITKIERISRGSKKYYIISLDYDYNKDIQPKGTVLGEFSIHPKTQLVTNITEGSTTLEVDSTVAFPKSGTLIIPDTQLLIEYTDKTLNQFLNCTGIVENLSAGTEVTTDSYAYGYDANGNVIRIRITGVLASLNTPADTKYYSVGDRILIDTLGEKSKDFKFNSWFFNVACRYKIQSIQLIDNSNRSYRINTKEKHFFNVGDSVTIFSSVGEEQIGSVDSFINENSFVVSFGLQNNLLNTNLEFYIKKNISKVNAENYTFSNPYSANVQNVYVNNNSLYVASSSLPSYSIRVNDRSVTFSGSFNGTSLEIGTHGYYTGDSVVYKPEENNTLGIETGVYFIKVNTPTNISLARSKSNIYTQNLISVSGNVTGAKLEYTDFTYRDLSTQPIESQKLIREISSPIETLTKVDTPIGQTGIFVNGVELVNYKSADDVYYGELKEIIPTAPGTNYDVTNPPTLTISDPTGQGAKGYCSVKGTLQRVEIIDPGFDYLEPPQITITGANGQGAQAQANLISFTHSVSFNAESVSQQVKLNPVNTISFSESHKFRDYEELIYVTENQKGIAGLTTNASYYASVQNQNTIKLHKTATDAISGINTVQLTDFGSGIQFFTSKNKKRKIGSIQIVNPGQNYQSKLTAISPVGINTSLNVITIPNHSYKSGEILTYRATETPIGGLTSSFSYYVTKINSDKIKLSATSFDYNAKNYINLTSVGVGTHKFNYQDIQLKVQGRIGISTLVGQDFNAVLRPIFRGSIDSVFVESGGSQYGSEEILNYNRQPQFELESGTSAVLKPIISSGKIVNVLIINPGIKYNSVPDIIINGTGSGAILTPILSNGSIIEVKVINSGLGYDVNGTSLTVLPAGSGAKFEARIQSWKINLIEFLINNSLISQDDGILSPGLNDEYGLEYNHGYAPRKLRSSVYGTFMADGVTQYEQDLKIVDNKEVASRAHSPIIGWAYDGNPIYGPYGYSSKEGGFIKLLKSGYSSSIKPNRPSISLYPEGIFVEDYSFTNQGDLDEHNGRFCVTPEYPNGTYAYFTTINDGPVDEDGIFTNYKRPVFPYVIGNSYKSQSNNFNFNRLSTQDYIDINASGWRRNISPYNLEEYEYLFNPNKLKPQESIVKSVSSGTIDFIGIVTGGRNYKIGDVITLQDGILSQSKVSLLDGKIVSQISVASSTFTDVKFYPFFNDYIGFTTVPHQLLNNDLVVINGIENKQKSSNISINTNSLVLSSGIGSALYTGNVAYFNVNGLLNYPTIRENDYYKINDEIVKILNIDEKSSRIRVLRNQLGTTGITSYNSGTELTELTRKFRVNFGISTSYNYNLDKELYFKPSETIGLGTAGITSTLYFSSPGVGITQITIPTQSLYFENHNLKTGDSLIYSSNGNTPVSVSNDDISSFTLTDNEIVYVGRLTKDIIGISTIPIGINSTGSFVGIGTTTGGLLSFTSFGTGDYHSFKTNYSNQLIGEISKNLVTVSTADAHGLSLNDSVDIKVVSGITTTVILQYDDYHKKLIVNPKFFTSINTIDDSITIPNHNFYTGQKVFYTSTSPATGLVNQNSYYVVAVDSQKIKLAETYYKATKTLAEVVNITSSSSGYILPINPPVRLIKNQTLVFDVSDSSLSYEIDSVSYSAFELKFYSDSSFVNEYNESIFKVTRTGRVGIDSTAKVTLNIDQETTNEFYYTLIPIYKDIFVDDEVKFNNQISLIESNYNGRQVVTGITTNTFNYNISKLPESSSYNKGVTYQTTSKTADGEISNINSFIESRVFNTRPGISSVITQNGIDSILTVESSNIGQVVSTEIEDIGFDYSVDYSVRPIAKYPSILSLDVLSSFDYIGITSFGRNYNTAPNLIAIDGLTNKVIPDVDLEYNIGNSRVTIRRNSTFINNVTPKIIPINNSNGYSISNIVFNNSTKDVIVTLGSSFSDPEDFPFTVGDRIFIEGVSVGIASTAKGYNSSNYNYSFFILNQVDSNLGGIGATMRYNIASLLGSNEVPGSFDSFFSSGVVVPISHFPIFDPILKRNSFIEGEVVSSSNANGNVISWDNLNQTLKVSTTDDFSLNEIVKGETSGSYGIIRDIVSYTGDYEISSSSIVRKGWNNDSGFLNNDFQRIHDSDYYQYFSYSLRTQKDFESWNDVVSSLNHAAGFKKFSDLIVESEKLNSGISTEQNQGDFAAQVDFVGEIDIECINDFDLATENLFPIDGIIKSNEIIFNSVTIQDYIESVGNRVLEIDDISSQFDSTKNTTEQVIDVFPLSDFRSRKYFTLIQNKRILSERQLLIATLVHNNSVGFMNQYGLDPYSLGFLDFTINGSEGNLSFFSTKDDLDIYYLTFTLNDISTGIGTINLGDSVKIETSNSNISIGTSTPTTIVGIASTYRATKVLVQIGSTNTSYYQFDEVTLLHDDSEISISNYGELTTSSLASSIIVGLGTYHAYYSGSNINLDFIPNETTSTDYNIKTINVSIGNSSVSSYDSKFIGNNLLVSNSVSIASSSSPISNVISQFESDDYNAYYCIINVEDVTNSQYEFNEVLVLSKNDECFITNYGVIRTNSTLGIITAGIDEPNTVIYFTPNPNIDVDVKVFQINLGTLKITDSYSLTNGSIDSDYGIFELIKTNFNLYYKGNPIFEKYFDGSNSNIVRINANTIRLSNHFFVTGEELNYSYNFNEEPIGIETTTIAGIGTTDKLPSKVYAVKLNDSDIRVSASATDALMTTPQVLKLTSVGVGNSHRFTSSTNKNSRSLISIDNVIQSPIVGTSVTSSLVNSINYFDDTLTVTGITSIFSGNLIKINDEIMKVISVNSGVTTEIQVYRSWLGTDNEPHNASAEIRKILGNYNIVDNKIYFETAPYGNIPTSDDDVTTGSTFNGRVFLKSATPDSENKAYYNNYVFDDISDEFDGIQKSFELKSERTSITGISTDNGIILINEIFQTPGSLNVSGDYNISESGTTSLDFTGLGKSTNYDVNTASIPRGGIIISYGSTEGFGYQPLVSAGGTAIVSVAGTIQSISIGNSGSGYRLGIQTVVNVGVTTENENDVNIEYIGTATISEGYVTGIAITNPGVGYTNTNPPRVIIDAPLSYSNLPLIYSSQSTSGVGTGASIDIVVGQGSSVISFDIKNFGFGYENNEILTVSIGGTTGIQTNSSSFNEFQIQVIETFADKFTGWAIGNLQSIDSVDFLFDGNKTVFPILIDGNRTTIRAKKGSNIDIASTLLIFINDILQVPNESYVFTGGSTFRFTEAPKEGDKCRILFYRGNVNVDTVLVDILENIKVGDNLTLNSDELFLDEDERLVTEIVSSDIANTNLYPGPGLANNESLLRPVAWCKQRTDKFINGQVVGKDRVNYEPYIQSTAFIIADVGVTTTKFFVDNVKTFFDSEKEYPLNIDQKIQNKIVVTSSVEAETAVLKANISGGQVSSIDIIDGGNGYTTIPNVIISSPVGGGTTATATASITNGKVNTITMVNNGSGYGSQEPIVLIESPVPQSEVIQNVTYQGDFGIITGIQTVSVGVASTGLVFDLFVPTNSILRDPNYVNVGIATTGISGIQTGYYFNVKNSNIGNGLISLGSTGNIVGLGTTFIDNTYQAVSVSIAQTAVPGIGLTDVTKVIVSINSYDNITGIGFSNYYGDFSWGLITTPARNSSSQFDSGDIVQRFNRLKFTNYVP